MYENEYTTIENNNDINQKLNLILSKLDKIDNDNNNNNNILRNIEKLIVDIGNFLKFQFHKHKISTIFPYLYQYFS